MKMSRMIAHWVLDLDLDLDLDVVQAQVHVQVQVENIWLAGLTGPSLKQKMSSMD